MSLEPGSLEALLKEFRRRPESQLAGPAGVHRCGTWPIYGVGTRRVVRHEVQASVVIEVDGDLDVVASYDLRNVLASPLGARLATSCWISRGSPLPTTTA